MYIYQVDEENANNPSLFHQIDSYIQSIKERPEVDFAIQKVEDGLHYLAEKIDPSTSQDLQTKQKIDKPNLNTPSEHTFSIHNIEMGDSKEEVEKQVGPAKRSSVNEYGVNWYAYHQNYQNFFMVAYDQNDKVAGLYTNQDLILSKLGVKMKDPKESVLQKLGKPIKNIQKGLVLYQIENKGEYHLFQVDNNYVTVFYDKHQNNTVTAVQIVSTQLERQKKEFFGEASKELKEGFEYQLFDLTNAARVKHGLSVLTWDDHVKLTARGHSSDMAQNHYFSHTNLEGMSPFDRMKEDNISFRAAGENLAAGQVSSIFAHEGLMNSLGHRKNILNTSFNSLGVGVAFDSESKPYYTENFLGN